jgi:hypothetical protein
LTGGGLAHGTGCRGRRSRRREQRACPSNSRSPPAGEDPSPGSCVRRWGRRGGRSGKTVRLHAETPNTRPGSSFLKIAARHRALESSKCRGTSPALRGSVPHKDPQKRREFMRKWRAANREKLRQASQKWRTANLDKARQSTRACREANPEKVRAQQRKYDAAKRARAKLRHPNATS